MGIKGLNNLFTPFIDIVCSWPSTQVQIQTETKRRVLTNILSYGGQLVLQNLGRRQICVIVVSLCSWNFVLLGLFVFIPHLKYSECLQSTFLIVIRSCLRKGFIVQVPLIWAVCFFLLFGNLFSEIIQSSWLQMLRFNIHIVAQGENLGLEPTSLEIIYFAEE